MAARKIGGGRVLGSGSSLAPVYPLRNSSLLSPSTSTVSVSSSSSTQPSIDAQDISSRISLDQGEGNNAAATTAASSRLACPICNEEMVTLLQLNRHLDDTHKNLEEVQQNEAKDWFKSRMAKAKRFQPLAVLNQKFKGLDIFDSESEAPRPLNLPPAAVTASTETPQPAQPDPDDVITKSHWQKQSLNDVCSEPECGRRLISANGSVNCRKCGRLFCDEHTMYKMKLSRCAQHEPVRGLWYRVCETCYKSREGYNDRTGFERDRTIDFERFRQKTVDNTFLEVSRLEKRLTKLTQLLANPPPDLASPASSLIWPLGGAKAQRKHLEQSVVDWEDDAVVPRCPFCQQEFSNYTFRRHHCRLCGKVVCGDPMTDCSKEIGLTVDTKKANGQVGVDVRMCKDCRTTIFSRTDFQEALAYKPPDVRAYENLVQFERGIRLMLPKFQRLLTILQEPDRPPSSAQLAEASRTRKRLVDAFGQYNTAARRIRDLPTNSPTQQKLQTAIFQQSSNFLQIHMLPLKALPKVLKHATPNGGGASGRSTPNGKPASALSSIKYNDIDNASQISSSSAVSALEAEEKTLRETLIVLEEQLFLVKEQVTDANKRRKFDEVSSLAQNVEDLSREIDQVQGQLAQLDFAGVYGAQSPSIIPKR